MSSKKLIIEKELYSYDKIVDYFTNDSKITLFKEDLNEFWIVNRRTGELIVKVTRNKQALQIIESIVIKEIEKQEIILSDIENAFEMTPFFQARKKIKLVCLNTDKCNENERNEFFCGTCPYKRAINLKGEALFHRYEFAPYVGYCHATSPSFDGKYSGGMNNKIKNNFTQK